MYGKIKNKPLRGIGGDSMKEKLMGVGSIFSAAAASLC